MDKQIPDFTFLRIIRNNGIKIETLTKELKQINEALWEIEDDIRDEERNKRFGDRFIELARAVYVTNDERANAKKKVNLHLNSTIVEEKSYQDYK